MRQLITSPNQVGEILRGRRRARRLNQKALAAKLGVSQTQLSRIESNAASLTLERLIAVANLLGLEIVIQDKTETSSQKTEW